MDLTPVALFGLLLVRPGMVIAVAPAFGGTHLPAHVKVALTVMIAIALVPSVVIPAPRGDVALTILVTREMVIGLSLALMVRALIAGAEFAGHLTSQQVGFSYAATVDPASGARNTVLASLYGMLATFGFLAINGHHAVLRALAASYAGLPIGGGHVDASLVDGVRQAFGIVFSVGLRLALPVIVALLVVELAVGFISRSAPPLNFFIIGYPLKLLVGLGVVALIIGTVPAVTGSLLDTTIEAALRFAAAFR